MKQVDNLNVTFVVFLKIYTFDPQAKDTLLAAFEK